MLTTELDNEQLLDIVRRQQRLLQEYAALVDGMDKQITRLLDLCRAWQESKAA